MLLEFLLVKRLTYSMITLQDLGGNTRTILDGQPYIKKTGEEIVKSEVGSREENQVLSTIEQIGQQKGLPLGEMIARLTHAFGIAPCSRCEQRRQVLNKISEVGVLKTLQLLKEIR